MLAVVVIGALGLSAAPPVDFARDVLPILSDKCFHCHGPDPATRRGGYRLDTKDGAFAKKKGEPRLVPGDSAASDLVARVLSADAGDQMPPPDSNRSLTAGQKATLKKWVDEGAKWGVHWAFAPLPATVPVPGHGHPIDAFVRDRLAREKLSPSPPASSEMWLRRVTLDLTGLPPTLSEIDAFLADRSPAAFDKVADRLLASPRYGERMASDWLDLARYADTHGYQMDRTRPTWPYRDWVIRAFNANQAFDQFLTEQLAGDLLPKATTEQKLATAFNRLHPQNEEGGVVAEEFRVAYVADRVATAGTAFLGLTLDCCRCHDHKYDPLTQKDYYSLFAFFQNIDESGQTSYFTTATPTPSLPLPTAEQEATIARLRAVVAAAERAAASHAGGTGGPVAAFSFELAGEANNATDPGKPGQPHDGPKPTAGKVGGGVLLSGEDGFTFPGIGHFSRSDPFTLALWLKPADHAERAVVLHHSKAPADAGSRGYELLLENGRVAFGLHHFWPGDSLKVLAKPVLPVGEWSHVTVSHDGSGRADGLRVSVNGRRVGLDVVRDCLRRDITYGGDEPPLTLGHRFRDRGFKGGAVDELRVFDRAVTAYEVALLAGVPPTDNDREDYKMAGSFGRYLFLFELQQLRRELAKEAEKVPEIMAMQELPAPKPAFLLKRGAYDAPGDAVSANTPGFLPPLGDAPRNRLGLVRWLTHPDHPLTARVTVNRLWQQLFGSGLVETSDNFGTTGTPPTHPELLDWLARDFVAHGWDVKRTLRQIVLSDTYRQDSRVSAELLARDPQNKLLARGPAQRLTAEMVRDQALFVSGLLVEKPGGPSVHPYQPAGLWDEAMGRPPYPQATGADLYRRSLYTVWKRTAPHPQLTTFDAADRSVCSARRQTTSTPLQSLALLNDPQQVEAARKLGERMLNEAGPEPTSRVSWIVRTVWGRPPTERERAILEKQYTGLSDRYTADPAAARALLAVGAAKPDLTRPPTELAAAAGLAQVVLSHDAAAVRR